MATFDKAQFLADLKQALAEMVEDDTTINDGQLRNTLVYAQHVGVIEQEPDAVLAMPGACRALRTLYAYHTLALALQDPRAWSVAVEAFPMENVPPQCTDLLLKILMHLEESPAPVQAALAGSVSDPLKGRLTLLRNALLARLGGIV